jgi:rhomboid protease GluP
MYAIDGDKIRHAKVTLILIIINVVCYIIFNPSYTFDLWLLMAQINSSVLNGEVWRLLTSIFMHADLIHLLSNMYGLFAFGVTVESFFNKKEFLVAYFSSGIVGSIFTLILFPPGTLSIGASGAIFGLMAISFVILARTDKRVLLFGIIYIVFAIQTSFQPGIGTWAHIFGFLTGLLFGYLYLRKTGKINKFYTSRPKRHY